MPLKKEQKYTVLLNLQDEDPATDKALSDDTSREYFKFEIALNDTGVHDF